MDKASVLYNKIMKITDDLQKLHQKAPGMLPIHQMRHGMLIKNMQDDRKVLLDMLKMIRQKEKDAKIKVKNKKPR